MGKWKRCWPHKWVKSIRYNAFSTLLYGRVLASSLYTVNYGCRIRLLRYLLVESSIGYIGVPCGSRKIFQKNF